MTGPLRQWSLLKAVYLFDTFAGMSPPTDMDVSWDGEIASNTARELQRDGYTDWCHASLDEVRLAFEGFGLLGPDVIFRKGRVEDTLRETGALPGRIALLRLDTDWYESTKVELEELYPRLEPGGVLIVDDYGHWQGARRAVTDYFGDWMPLLVAVDYTCRVAVKPGAPSSGDS